MGIVEECKSIMDWMEKEALLQSNHPIYVKMKTIKTTLDAQKTYFTDVENDS